MGREEAGIQLRRRDTDQCNRRAVMQVQHGIAAIVCGGATTTFGSSVAAFSETRSPAD
jgi:hypothetical protein